MTQATDAIADLRKYAALTSDRLRYSPGFSPGMETANAVQVERGIVLTTALSPHPNPPPQGGREPDDEVERLIELAPSQLTSPVAVIDASGHHRPLYRPLLIYAWLVAFRLRYETLPRSEFGRWDEALRSWCDLLEAELGQRSGLDGATPAIMGPIAAETAWSALALHVAGKVFIRDAWTDLAGDAMGRLTRGQQPSGAFLDASSADNPESAWFHELAILHAVSSYAVQAEDRGVARAVARNTEFHLREIQPDHATSQPWGLFAFVWNPATRSLADQLLHTVQLLDPQRSDALSLILLSDALYCLRLFI
jgi:hypothetical protein